MSAAIVQLFLGWMIADFLSGLFHWIEDRVLFQGEGWLGRHVVGPNRLHHEQPLAFLEGGFIERNGTTWLVALPLAAAWFWLLGPSLVLIGALAGALMVNEVHRLAHRSPPKHGWLRVAQQIGIIQSPTHHAGHHRQPDSRYCVLTGWLNPIVGQLRLWEGLEHLLVVLRVPISRGER